MINEQWHEYIWFLLLLHFLFHSPTVEETGYEALSPFRTPEGDR